ncbi:MAG: universal stress protein [Gammaproteobacteria bacterium]|nr:universal stress protein [Pseudomonadales bacterium]MCP5345428.1 universal stress protein [Pseudomonadales bacterium]
MSTHVLVVADHQLSHSVALSRASEFVGESDTKITVLAFIDTGGSNDEEISLREQREALLSTAAKILGRRPNLSLELVSTLDIASYCADFCRQNQVDLVVKAGHRSEPPLYTPLDWRLLKSLPCPVIIAVNRQGSGQRKLLVTLDSQSHSPTQKALDRKVLDWSAAWVRDQDYALYIACCVEASDPLTNTDIQQLMELESRMRLRIEPVIRQMLEELSLPCKGILVSAGTPASVLRRLADELDADLVAVGYTARHGLGELLIGHTAEQLMLRMDKNLAVIPGATE